MGPHEPISAQMGNLLSNVIWIPGPWALLAPGPRMSVCRRSRTSSGCSTHTSSGRRLGFSPSSQRRLLSRRLTPHHMCDGSDVCAQLCTGRVMKKKSQCDPFCEGSCTTGDALVVPDHDDWDLGTDDFTIEFWMRPMATYYEDENEDGVNDDDDYLCSQIE